MHKLLALFGILTFVSCTPVAANAVSLEITQENCTYVKTIASQMIRDFKHGASQVDAMRDLNSRPMKDFGPNGETVKVYLQVNVGAIQRNVVKAYKSSVILNTIEHDCTVKIGNKL